MIDDRWVGDHQPGSNKNEDATKGAVMPTNSNTTSYISAPRDSGSGSKLVSFGQSEPSFFSWLMGLFFSSSAYKPSDKSKPDSSSSTAKSTQSTESGEAAKQDAPAGKDESGNK